MLTGNSERFRWARVRVPAIKGQFAKMKIAVLKERKTHEARVAASPETVKKLVDMGHELVVEKGAGAGADFADAEYKDAGATIAKDAKTAAGGAAVVLKVQRPSTSGQGPEVGYLDKGTCESRRHRVLNGFHAAYHARSVDGRALIPG